MWKQSPLITKSDFYLRFLILLTLIVIPKQIQSQAPVINELMPSPEAGEPEWIELYNPHQISVNLIDCFITDAASSHKLPIFTIPEFGYAVLTKDSTSLRIRRHIPDKTVLIQCQLPQLNNNYDVITFRFSDSSLIDSAYYDMSWGKKGISLERLDWEKVALSKDNLAPSISPDSATCGYQNSLIKINTELIIQSAIYAPTLKTIKFIIHNSGKKNINNMLIEILADSNKNSVFESNELVWNLMHNGLDFSKSDTIIINAGDLIIPKELFGYIECQINITAISDYDTLKIQSDFEFHIAFPPQTILINEIMYDVKTGDADYVELLNSSDDTINLRGYYIHDFAANEFDEFLRIDSNLYIYPSGYALISTDSSIIKTFPKLEAAYGLFISNSAINFNKSDDEVVLLNPDLSLQDSLHYYNSWHTNSSNSNQGISLERISPILISTNPETWHSSSDSSGGTPLQNNTAAVHIEPQNELAASPNPFSSSKTGQTYISYKIDFDNPMISANIYDTGGTLVRTLVQNSGMEQSGIISWNGKNEAGFNLPSGPYILILDANNSFGSRFSSKIMIVLAE